MDVPSISPKEKPSKLVQHCWHVLPAPPVPTAILPLFSDPHAQYMPRKYSNSPGSCLYSWCQATPATLAALVITNAALLFTTLLCMCLLPAMIVLHLLSISGCHRLNDTHLRQPMYMPDCRHAMLTLVQPGSLQA
jgi:hypothetical protein